MTVVSKGKQKQTPLNSNGNSQFIHSIAQLFAFFLPLFSLMMKLLPMGCLMTQPPTVIVIHQTNESYFSHM